MASFGGQPDNKSIKETADTLRELTDAIKEFNHETSRHSKIILGLTFLMAIGLVIQIWIDLSK